MAFKSIEEIDAAGNKLTNEHRINLQTPTAKWTGWKYCGYDVMVIREEMVKDWDAGFVSQLIWYKMQDGNNWPAEYGYYVNLPGMQSGKFMPGGSFNIGFEQMRPEAPPSEIDAMLANGWQKLVSLVKEKEGVDISEFKLEPTAA